MIQRDGAPEAENSFVKIQDVSERELMSALDRLQQKQALVAYFATGHGEPSFRTDQPESLSRFRELADAERVELQEISLLEEATKLTPETPLLIIAPKKAFDEVEQRVVSDHLSQGGTVVFAAEYFSELHSSTDFVRQGGIQIEPQPLMRAIQGPSGERHLSADLPVRLFRRHDVTSYLTGSASVLFSEALPLKRVAVRGDSAPTRIQDLLRFQVNKDQRIILSYLAEWENGGKLLVFGDASWLSNAYLSRAFNRELARGTLLWSTGALLPGEVIAPDPARLIT